MAARHPDWFEPSSFSREVLHFSLREIGWFPPQNFIPGEREFVEAVRTIGSAVFTLQVIIRNRLRPLFMRSINVVAGVVDGHRPIEILEFMTQGYLHNDIFNTILSCFAIIAELILFFDEFGFPIPPNLYTSPWFNIYAYRLRDGLLLRGGIEKLVEEAKIRYIDTNLYSETLFSLRNNIPIPYAESFAAENWPENPLEFLHERIGVAPQIGDLAMNILRELYSGHGIVPPDYAVHLVL